MRNIFKICCIILIALTISGVNLDSFAQVKNKKHHRSLRDSLRERVLHRDSVIRSFKHSNSSINNLLAKIEDYTTSYVETNNDLSRGFDTLEISQHLPPLEKRMALMRNTINKSTTLGNLVTIRGMIDHLKDQMSQWEDQVTVYNNELDDIHTKVSDFKSDTGLRTIPADSGLRERCFIEVQSLERKWNDLDNSVQKSIIRIGVLENRISALSILLIDLDDRIDLKVHEFTLKSVTNEYGFIWDRKKAHALDRLDSTLVKTVRLNALLYSYFLTSKSNWGGHLASLLTLIVFFAWIYHCRRKVIRDHEEHNVIFDQIPYIAKHPYLSTLMVISILSPYFYDHPMQVFAHTMLLIMMGSMGILIKENSPIPLFKFWRILFIAAIIFCLSSLLVTIAYEDRIILLLVSGLIIYQSIKLLRQIKISPDTYPMHLSLILKIYIVLNFVSMLLNLTGRFSLAKIVEISATLNICLAAGFYLLVQILMESLFLQLEVNKNPDQHPITSYLDFKTLQKKSKGFLVKITAILWLVALAKNLTIDDYLYDQGNDFLNHPYKISSTAFTFRSVLVFIIVIWTSGLVARVISYFYDFAGQQTKLTPQAKKTRSSILLIRLTIFVVGFFVAITAAGIPMDRVTIVIGALGVGIGFGLQNIVNNLVSGVILAFEKPVQVGDIIEVSGKSGTIKEIGIRSSKIECGDGSELIIPNGDLISQHVVNWTLTNNHRRVELLIRVAYGTDVEKVENILNGIVQNHVDIMKTPAASVFLYNFSDTAIEFRALFWTADISKWLTLKSSVMRAIYVAFEQEKIEIPQGQLQVLFPESGIHPPANINAPGSDDHPDPGK
ncbi:mechanosensitive ion channel family protein [Mucilaginibacter sp. SP1R1]|uniref:mechanosensitive ion channel family protein n=1 Tax=Mucilaginibacter sp. SP1R1 TaxID=2723091 RepID=UPI0016200C58|nr:mechanosensitive ion channel domain-containing protein [Mucilaginibacter sp. SP1R1]MBB6152707.1 small-conductance mechanosensitive channel [Mucilaginibacter sp. SP1R1]